MLVVTQIITEFLAYMRPKDLLVCLHESIIALSPELDDIQFTAPNPIVGQVFHVSIRVITDPNKILYAFFPSPSISFLI
jgi:hypothetical protein